MSKWVEVRYIDKPIDDREIREGGPDFWLDDFDDLDVISEAKSDNEYTVAHYQGKAVLVIYEEGEYCGYYAPVGYGYEQEYQGFRYMVVE